MSDERKERVIHTRVPESLEAELKDRAAEMGVSVSNLVRNVLSHALGLVNDIVADTEQIVRSAREGVEASVRKVRGQPGVAEPSYEPAPVVIAWQTAVLERNAICHRCNDILPRGSDAAIALIDGPAAGPRPVVCLRCLEELRHGSTAPRRPDDDR